MKRASLTWLELCGLWTAFSLLIVLTPLYLLWNFVVDDLVADALRLAVIVTVFVWLPGVAILAVVAVVEALVWGRPNDYPLPANRDWRSAARIRGRAEREP